MTERQQILCPEVGMIIDFEFKFSRIGETSVLKTGKIVEVIPTILPKGTSTFGIKVLCLDGAACYHVWHDIDNVYESEMSKIEFNLRAVTTETYDV